jgi:hypothetical protein
MVGTLTSQVDPHLADDGVDPRLAALRRYWDAVRGRRAMPSRADIDPADIPRLLPHLFLVDVGATVDDLRWRLAGTEVVRLFGLEVTGRPVGTGMLPTAGRLMRARFAFVARNAHPAYATGVMQAERNDHTPFQRLLLPLSSDGVRVDMLVGILVGLRFDRLLASPARRTPPAPAAALRL